MIYFKIIAIVFSLFFLALCHKGCVGGVCWFNSTDVCKCFPGYSGDDCSIGMVWYGYIIEIIDIKCVLLILKPFLHEQFLCDNFACDHFYLPGVYRRAKLGNFCVANTFFEKLACRLSCDK